MSVDLEVPLVIGCHHKTGTNLIYDLGRVIGMRLWRSEQIVWGKSEDRKLPLSLVLRECSQNFRCYLNIWFEHEVDVPASSIRLLHFIRHPAKWIRSAYLYHKAGAVSDHVRWLDWRIFRYRNAYVSYAQLLDVLSEEHGLMLETIRSYPEIASTARVAQTSTHLTMRQQLSLEQVQTDLPGCVRALAILIGFDAEIEAIIIQSQQERPDGRDAKKTARPNATHGSPRASHLERYLMEDPTFHRLYSEPAREMGFTFTAGALRSKSVLAEDFLDQLHFLKKHMITDARQSLAQESLCSGGLKGNWNVYALQAFGDGGHLLTYETMQAYLDSLGQY